MKIVLGLLPLLVLMSLPVHGQTVDIVTFNDVYEIQPVAHGRLGGAARVAAELQSIRVRDPNTLVLFAGDLLSPSIMSSVFHGRQMVAAMNQLGLNYATIGNHEFDFGLATFKKRVAQSDFTWLSANIVDSGTGKPIAGTQPDALVTVGGIKFGLFGLAYDFSSILRNPSAVKFLDPIATARAEVNKLKSEGAQYIVALTHEGHSKDCLLSAKVGGIDLIAGGHDHSLMMDTQCGHAPYVKASSDWRNIWDLRLDFAGPAPAITYRSIPITSVLPQDAAMAALVKRYTNKLDVSFGRVVGRSSVPLDALGRDVRAKETNLGDFIADAMRQATGADVAIMNGGGIRSNQTYPAGPITKKIVYAVLPFGNEIVVVKATGKVLKEALENGVSQLQDYAGRFPQVSGMRFAVDRHQPAGDRVSSVTISGKPLLAGASYTVAISGYLHAGGDGYRMFKHLPTVVSANEGPVLAEVVAKAIAAKGTIAPHTEGRIRIK